MALRFPSSFLAVEVGALPVLEYYWPLLADFVNALPGRGRSPADARIDGLWVDMRNALTDVARGGDFVGAARPVFTLRSDARGVRFLPRRPRTFDEYVQALRTALILVQTLRTERVRLCDRGNACGRFFLSSRALQRPRYFCSDKCRFGARSRRKR